MNPSNEIIINSESNDHENIAYDESKINLKKETEEWV